MISHQPTAEHPPTRAAPRSGLAPLELVLALPLLLCLMALIVNFAHAATWKIRSATGARLAMWRHRPLWDADSDPNPVNYWPPGASLSVPEGPRISQVDPVWNQPSIGQGWIKGPVFTAGGGYLALRDNRVNEMSEGVSKGKASVSLKYPFLPSMGTMTMPAEHTLLDSVWQFHTMGYGWNSDRRARGWWQLENGAEWAAQRQVFLMSDQRMTGNPQRELLRPLDRDAELIARGMPFDFYARLGPPCLNDVRQVHDILAAEGGFHDRIDGDKRQGTPGVSERMARSYLQMYQMELDILLAQDNPPADRVALLKKWIKELTAFMAKLQ